MSISGTDPTLHRWGGGEPLHLERFLDALPGTLLSKAAAGVVPQDEVIDAALRTGHPYGREPTTPNRPTLGFPTWTMRSAGERQEVDNRWQEAFQQLAEALPAEIQALLIREMNKPVDARIPAVAALNNMLILLSRFTVWAEEVATPYAAGSLQQMRSALNSELMSRALHALTTQMAAITEKGLALLAAIGANDPEHDKLLHHLQAIQGTITDMEALAAGNSDPTALAAVIAQLARHYHHTSGWGQMQMAGPLLIAMRALTSTATLPEGLQPFGVALHIANVGIDSERGGPFGTALYSIVQQLAEPFESAIASPLITIWTLMSTVIGYTLFDISGNSSADAFTAEMLLVALFEQPWLEALADVPSAPLKSSLELLTASLLIHMIHRKNSRVAEQLINAWRPQLIERLATLEGSSSNSALTTALMEGRLALENDDIPTFLRALNGAVAAMGVDVATITKEIAELTLLANNMALYLNAQNLEAQTGNSIGVIQA